MLTLNIFHTYFSVSIVDFEKVTVSWKEAFRIFFQVLQSEAKDLVEMYPGLLQTPKMEQLKTIITKCFILMFAGVWVRRLCLDQLFLLAEVLQK